MILTPRGLVTYERLRQPMFSPENLNRGKTYREEKAGQIDEAIGRVIEEAHQRVREILSGQRKALDNLAHLLSQKEMVQGEELRRMLGKTLAENPPPAGSA